MTGTRRWNPFLRYGVTINWQGGELPLEADCISDFDGGYLAGFADGEGCFFISGQGSASFIVKLRDDDLPLLEWCQRTTGVGRISRVASNKSNQQPQAVWTTSRKRECLWLTELFDCFPLRGKKARDFAIWRQAVIDGSTGAPPGSLLHYRDALMQGRAYAASAGGTDRRVGE